MSAIEGASVLYGACEAEMEAPNRLGVAGIAAMVVVVLERGSVFPCISREEGIGCRLDMRYAQWVGGRTRDCRKAGWRRVWVKLSVCSSKH